MGCLLLHPWTGSTVYRWLQTPASRDGLTWLLPAHTHCWLSQLLCLQRRQLGTRGSREASGAPHLQLCSVAWPDGVLAQGPRGPALPVPRQHGCGYSRATKAAHSYLSLLKHMMESILCGYFLYKIFC